MGFPEDRSSKKARLLRDQRDGTRNSAQKQAPKANFGTAPGTAASLEGAEDS